MIDIFFYVFSPQYVLVDLWEGIRCYCSCSPVFDMQLLAAISDTYQRSTQRFASKTGIKCSRLT